MSGGNELVHFAAVREGRLAPQPPASATLLSIHYLRAFAAVMVVLYHIYSHGMLTDNPSHAFQWLKHGVAIFFVISGFVMVYSTDGKSISSKDFFVRRIIRIMPLYWFFTLAWYFTISDKNSINLFQSLFFLPPMDLGTSQLGEPVLNVGWSLNFEMFFYALFAAALILPRAWPVRMAALTLTGAVFARGWFADSAQLAYFASPVLLEFVGGMLIAHFRLRVPAWILPFALAAFVVTPFATEGRFFTVSVPAMLVVASVLSLERRLPRIPAMMMLGDASYAIYLSHMFVMWVTFALLTTWSDGPSLVTLLALPVSILAGVLTHRTIELPMLRFFGSLQTRRPQSSVQDIAHPSQPA